MNTSTAMHFLNVFIFVNGTLDRDKCFEMTTMSQKYAHMAPSVTPIALKGSQMPLTPY